MKKDQIRDFLNKNIFKADEQDESLGNLHLLKNRIYSLVSFLIVLFSGPLLVYGAYLFYQKNDYLQASLEIIVYIIVIISMTSPNIGVDLKKIIMISLIYFFGLVLLLSAGPQGAGQITIVLSFVLSSSVLGKKQNILFFIFNLAIFIMITVFLSLGFLKGLAISQYENYWLINVLTLQLVLMGMVFLHQMIYDGLEKQTEAVLKSKKKLAVSEERYRILADNTADVIWVYNVDLKKFVYISPAIKTLRGLTVEEALKESLEESVIPEFRAALVAEIAKSLNDFLHNPTEPEDFINEFKHPCKDGTSVWVETASRYRFNANGEVEIISSSRNIMERKEKEAQIEYLDDHDPLTGLFNRKALMKRMLKDEKQISVISINIDNFRVINEELGHKGGDRILQELSENIMTAVTDIGQVYRIGGDEFVVVIKNNYHKQVLNVAEKISKAVSRQFKSDSKILYITVSLGIGIGDENEDLSEIIKKSDTALYVAKKEKNQILLYQPSMEKRRSWEAILEKDLSSALENKEFELVFQPIYDINQHKFNQAEALLRWNHPDLGEISPVDFIPIAEKTRLIIPITNWVIKEVCKQSSKWASAGLGEMIISINISILLFENRGSELLEAVQTGIDEAMILASSIKLEITESCLIRDTNELIKTFSELKKIGVKLALDDFGTGYSFFGSIKDLPLDVIKLDRSLIAQIDIDLREQQIIKALITIIHNLKIKIVAEGIETVAEFEILQQMGCDYIQGFYFSQPLKASDLFFFCTNNS
ncbi:bifunctional diguanylate cyclase/phosphodiesterase [Eubacteriaceae bacterium ES2]|nr:bifunctional diguanylate cyclase/phosphodiesterase [Eubacteriaceae bacterium ES2]